MGLKLSELGPFWTLANALSLSRIVLAVPITIVVFVDASRYAWVIVGLGAVAAATDFLDGYVARRTGTITEWGKVLDPIGDKFLLITVGGAMVVVGLLPLWLVGFIVARDLIIVIGGLLISQASGIVPSSLWWGKVAMVSVAVTFLAVTLQASEVVQQICFWLTAALMMISFVQYAVRFMKLHRATS